MININASETLILSSAVLAFAHIPLAIAALSLGVIGALIRFTIGYGEKQQKIKEVEETKENISSIISKLTASIQSGDRDNLH